MQVLTRRTLAAAAVTLAAATPFSKPRAQALQGIDALQPLSQPKKLEGVQFAAADGTVKSLADYAGQGVVLNMWATWCVPCVREMPALDDLAKALKGSGVTVLAVSSDRGGAAVVQRFYAEHQIANLPVLLDPNGAMARLLAVRGIPTTLLIDREGREVAFLEGSADWSAPDAITVVRKIAAV